MMALHNSTTMCTEKTVNVTDLNDLSSLSIESGIVLPKKLGHRYTYDFRPY